MEELLTSAFDGITIEELSPVCPVQITADISAEVLQRIRSRVLARLGAENEKAAEAPAVLRSDPPARRRNKLFRTLLIAAIIALLAAASALALSLGGGRFLASLFGQKNYDIIQQYVMADLAQASDGKLNLTLESALSDGHYHFVVFSVGMLDGSSLGDRFPDVKFSFALETPSRIQPGFQLERLASVETTDSRAYYIALIHSSQGAILSMRMEISRLFAFDGRLEDIPAALAVEADFAPCPLAVGGDDSGVFRNIELSPFGLWIDVHETWEEDDSLSAGLPIYDISLLYEDGSLIGASAEQFADPEHLESIGWGGMQMPNGTHQSYISVRFASFVDIGEVEAVVIQGQKYPLSRAED